MAAGGILSLPDIELAGLACAVGVDGWRLITTTDPVEKYTLAAIAVEAHKARAELSAGQPLGLGGGE